MVHIFTASDSLRRRQSFVDSAAVIQSPNLARPKAGATNGVLTLFLAQVLKKLRNGEPKRDERQRRSHPRDPRPFDTMTFLIGVTDIVSKLAVTAASVAVIGR